jgi:CheY-like chemotaxis protein
VPIEVSLHLLQATPSAEKSPPPGGLRVLAAEDNATNQMVLKTLLGAVGIEPVIVADGAEALEAWRGGEWDVVLMDIQMPIMDGIAATKAIRRAENATGRVSAPIIALTANAMQHHQAEYLAAGMNGFVAKPIDLGLLLQAIDAVLPEAEAPPLAVAA